LITSASSPGAPFSSTAAAPRRDSASSPISSIRGRGVFISLRIIGIDEPRPSQERRRQSCPAIQAPAASAATRWLPIGGPPTELPNDCNATRCRRATGLPNDCNGRCGGAAVAASILEVKRLAAPDSTGADWRFTPAESLPDSRSSPTPGIRSCGAFRNVVRPTRQWPGPSKAPLGLRRPGPHPAMVPHSTP
jgi:hypothetical protein